MIPRLPEIRPISDLARDAKGLIERARERQEPIVITQRGRDAAVLIPIELYRDLERREPYRVVSPRLVNRDDAEYFALKVEVVEADADL